MSVLNVWVLIIVHALLRFQICSHSYTLIANWIKCALVSLENLGGTRTKIQLVSNTFRRRDKFQLFSVKTTSTVTVEHKLEIRQLKSKLIEMILSKKHILCSLSFYLLKSWPFYASANDWIIIWYWWFVWQIH